MANSAPTDSSPPPEAHEGPVHAARPAAARSRIAYQHLKSLETQTSQLSESDKILFTKLDLLHGVMADVKNIQADVKDIKAEARSHLWRLLSAYGAGVVLILGAMASGYFRLEDRSLGLRESFGRLETSFSRVDQKIDDLLQRIPPAQTAPGRH